MDKITAMIEGLENLKEQSKMLNNVNKMAMEGLASTIDGTENPEAKKILLDIHGQTQTILKMAKDGNIKGITKIHEDLLKKYAPKDQE